MRKDRLEVGNVIFGNLGKLWVALEIGVAAMDAC